MAGFNVITEDDEPDSNFVLREDFNRGIDKLQDWSLSFDLLIFEDHLPQTITFVDRHPNQIFVLDHIAKPRIREGSFHPWRERLIERGRRENVYRKLSGMVTESSWTSWTAEQLMPYIETALESFGPQRLMPGWMKTTEGLSLAGIIFVLWLMRRRKLSSLWTAVLLGSLGIGSVITLAGCGGSQSKYPGTPRILNHHRYGHLRRRQP